MNLPTDFGEQVRDKRGLMTLHEAARRAKVSPATLSAVERGEIVTDRPLIRIRAWLNYQAAPPARKIIQIVADPEMLYALDNEGNVWSLGDKGAWFRIQPLPK